MPFILALATLSIWAIIPCSKPLSLLKYPEGANLSQKSPAAQCPAAKFIPKSPKNLSTILPSK